MFVTGAGDGDGGPRRGGDDGLRHHHVRDPVRHGALINMWSPET